MSKYNLMKWAFSDDLPHNANWEEIDLWAMKSAIEDIDARLTSLEINRANQDNTTEIGTYGKEFVGQEDD